MRIKLLVKYLIGWLKCRFNHIECGDCCYLGINLNIINKGNFKLGDNVKFRPSLDVYISRNALLSIGDHTEIGNHFTISAHNIVIIGKGVLTSPHVFIADHNHEYRNPDVYIYKQGCRAGKDDRVLIDDGTWLGTNVVVVGNVHIGKQCVIGANSVVTKDIPDYCVAAGSPAKVLKRYNFESKEWERFR